MNGIIYLSNVRLSFPHLTEPQITKSVDTGLERKSWNAEFLVDPASDDWRKFFEQCNKLAAEKWKDNAAAVMQMIMSDRKKRCFAKGEEKVSQKTFKPYETHIGKMAISAGRDTPPQMIQVDGRPVDPANTMEYQAVARTMYAGCRVNVALKPWTQNNKHGVALRCDLVALQFAGDDQPFGDKAIDASGMFGATAAPSTPAPAPAWLSPAPAATAAMPGLPVWQG